METMERNAEFIADRCRYIRKMLGWAQENLADAASLTTRTIEKTESGRHTPSVQTLLSIARAVGFDVKVFSKPTPEQEKRLEEELECSLRKTSLVPTSPIRTANDFYSRNREWHAFMSDASAVEVDDALQLTAAITEWITDLDGIWELSSHSQRLDYATSIAELCRELEGLGYLTHFGSFRQQHMNDKGLIFFVALVTFLPKAENDGDRYALVNLDDPWEIPDQDRPKV